MHLTALPATGPAPVVERTAVAPLHERPGGVAPRYALDGVDWLWDSNPPPKGPAFRLFRLRFSSTGSPLRFQVSADQFFWLTCDGHVVARGPDVSPPWFYAFAEYEVRIPAGPHLLEAFVWWMGDLAPEARMTTGTPGFAMAGIAEARDLLSTGFAPWKVARLEGYTLEPDAPQAEVLATGKNSLIDARAAFATPLEWLNPVVSQRRLGQALAGRQTPRLLTPSRLPEMPLRAIAPGRIRAVLEGLLGDQPLPDHALAHPELGSFTPVLSGDGEAHVVIPRRSSRTLIWDLETYASGWPEVMVSGGRDAVIRQIWSESFYEKPDCRTKQKGNRDEIVGKYLVEGLGDRFIADGGPKRRFIPYWWRCSRYCRIDITTGDEPLILHRLALHESGHPFDFVGRFSCDQDARLQPVLEICRRTLEASSWDTYQDCPYFEQLQYVADTRLEILMTYVLNRNAVLPLQALELIDQSRHQWHGLASARFPSRGSQFISTFSLVWVWCVRDLVFWRDECALVARLLPGVRTTIDLFLQWRTPAGLLEELPGWPYIDWVTPDRQKPGVWQKGIPASGTGGVSALINLVYLLSLQAAAEIEAHAGEPEFAARVNRLAEETSRAIRARFWCPINGAIKDDDSGQHWSSHAQIYGILSGVLTPEEGSGALDRAAREDWVPPSCMFKFYEFEALKRLGRAGEIFERLEVWHQMVARGSRTVWESLEPTRSDCHAWSSHPLFHLPCSIAGIRPLVPGFEKVEIAPQFGPLAVIETAVGHPRGTVRLSVEKRAGRIKGSVEVPPLTSGIFRFQGHSVELVPGSNEIELSLRG